MNLLNLPNELIVSIANYLKQSESLSCFARTNRHVHSLVMPLLYQHNIKYGGCTGLKAQLTLQTEDSMSRYFTRTEVDLKEYNNPSDLTTPEGLPIPVTDKIRSRDFVIGQFIKYGVNLDNLHPGEYDHGQEEYNQEEYDEEKSLLHYHAAVRNPQAVFLLAKHGADIHATTGYEERTALHQAALDVNARDWEGKTPLHLAAAEGHIAAIRLLFENGANINAQDELGCTPLHHMVTNGKSAPDSWCILALKVMLELGPNTELGMFEDNKTPLHVAILDEREVESMEILLESGMDLNSRTTEGWTPLSCCMERRGMHVFMMLVKAGADIHSRDNDGRSLLQIALEDDEIAYGCLPTLL
ncbi:hypothetical protein V502_05563 [Pseudogymnoascus sp. VKM F-4520 (FW-2644)]|nr:hypothetical protein V502_05563 [Pseudogymnoascus sp. VKM F-4520 (FW-2644)]